MIYPPDKKALSPIWTTTAGHQGKTLQELWFPEEVDDDRESIVGLRTVSGLPSSHASNIEMTKSRAL